MIIQKHINSPVRRYTSSILDHAGVLSRFIVKLAYTSSRTTLKQCHVLYELKYIYDVAQTMKRLHFALWPGSMRSMFYECVNQGGCPGDRTAAWTGLRSLHVLMTREVLIGHRNDCDFFVHLQWLSHFANPLCAAGDITTQCVTLNIRRRTVFNPLKYVKGLFIKLQQQQQPW